MKKILITLAALGLTTGAALAQDAAAATISFDQADADKSGEVSLAEAQVGWPALTEEAFQGADTDKSGSLNQAEYDAYGAGVAPTPTEPALGSTLGEDEGTDASSPNSPDAPTPPTN